MILTTLLPNCELGRGSCNRPALCSPSLMIPSSLISSTNYGQSIYGFHSYDEVLNVVDYHRRNQRIDPQYIQ